MNYNWGHWPGFLLEEFRLDVAGLLAPTHRATVGILLHQVLKHLQICREFLIYTDTDKPCIDHDFRWAGEHSPWRISRTCSDTLCALFCPLSPEVWPADGAPVPCATPPTNESMKIILNTGVCFDKIGFIIIFHWKKEYTHLKHLNKILTCMARRFRVAFLSTDSMSPTAKPIYQQIKF